MGARIVVEAAAVDRLAELGLSVQILERVCAPRGRRGEYVHAAGSADDGRPDPVGPDRPLPA
ncbi:hypothetical protein [Fodinicola feengrottensis]|uniref:hypothetical protein n=1 Tax=Fodinicola feengrottensis TaxID=435914 RepID=UPI0013D0B110|nr:hypothetical protein [Fodinicola feengrottensis]